MHRLVEGIQEFQQRVSRPESQQRVSRPGREMCERLAKGQNPGTLFITCSDSRINPNRLTGKKPGELLILRNAGNIVPPFGALRGGEVAMVEYAAFVLGVKDIIIICICGHSGCGAVSALPEDACVDTVPALEDWLGHAEAARRIVEANYPGLGAEELVNVAIQENVLDHLRTHPAVAAGLARGALGLHAWVYTIATGKVFAYNTALGRFVPLGETTRPALRGLAALATTRAI